MSCSTAPVELVYNLLGLVGAVAEIGHGFADLRGPRALGFHGEIDLLEAGNQCLNLLNDGEQLSADSLNVVHPLPNLLDELVDFHDTRGNGRLHLLDHPVDMCGGHSGLIGKPPYLAGNHREAQSVFPRFFSLDGCIE